jgi:hypothetical protein
MGIFRSTDSEAYLRKSIDAERTLHGELEARLVSARKAAEDRRHAALKAVRDLADDRTLQALEEKQVAAGHRVQNLISERDDSTARLGDLESQLADVMVQKRQAEAAKVVEQHAADLVTVGATLDSALRDMSALAGKIAVYCIDARGIHIFTGSARGEISANISMLQTILKGAFPPELVLAKPAPKPLPAPQPAPTVPVLSTKPISWHDADGMLHAEPKWKEVSLPVAAANRAVKIGAAVRQGDPLWKQKGYGPIYSPKLSDCVDLDYAPLNVPSGTEHQQPPEIHTAFQRVDRGPAFNLKVSRNEPIPASATRDLPKGDK